MTLAVNGSAVQQILLRHIAEWSLAVKGSADIAKALMDSFVKKL